MKWGIYTLLLLNIIMLVWHLHLPEIGNSVSVQESQASPPQLVMLDEIGQSAPAKSSTETRCYNMGPFASQARSRAAAAKMEQSGIKVKEYRNDENTRKGFWVLLPPEKSRDKAQEVIQQLKQLGEKDFFLVMSGEQVNGVSLGVFSQSESAQRRVEQVRSKGFEPVVQNVQLPGTDYWLQWPRHLRPTPNLRLIQQIRQQNRDIGVVERTCR